MLGGFKKIFESGGDNCDHGQQCTTVTCQRKHPPGRPVPCRNNLNAGGCTQPDCSFLHPPKKPQCGWEFRSPTGVCWVRATSRACNYRHQLTDEDYEFLAQENKGKCCHGPSMLCKQFLPRPCRLAEEQHRDFSAELQKRFPQFGPPQQCHWEESSPTQVCWRRVGEFLCGNLHSRSDDDYAFITLHTKKQNKCYHGPSLRCKPRCARPVTDHQGYSVELCARFPAYEEKVIEEVKKPPIIEGTAGDDTEKLCCICLDSQRTHLVLDCFHLCMCEGCSKDLKKCPLCNGEVRELRRVYM